MIASNKIDEKLIIFFKKHCFEILFFIITIVSLLARFKFMNFESEDYTTFLSRWFESMKEQGGIFSLGTEIGNYNIPYIFIMTLLTYLPINPLFSIKIVSICFDYAMAFASMFIIYELLKENKNKHFYAILTYSTIIMLPTVTLNSSAWAQCDSIYSTFILLTILCMLKEKYTKSFVFFGIAFAFKLQAIFILPVLIIIYISSKKFSIINFLIIPITNFTMCLPAIIAGRTIISCMKVYINQAETYEKYISMNIPNIYAILIKTIGESNLISNIDNAFSNYGILMTLAIFSIIAVIVAYKEIKFEKKDFINLTLLSVLICTFFLPSMHDRYMYLADIISVIYFIVNRKKPFIPIIINLISLYTYIEYLYGTKSLPIQYVAILNLIILFLVTKETIKLQSGNINIKIHD